MARRDREPRPKSLGRTNKRKGSNAERYYAQIFRDLGFDKCVTSRMGSKLHDDSCIDLIFIPLNVQVKAGRQRGMNVSQVLREMSEQVAKNFPEDYPEHERPKIVIHKKDVGSGKKRTEFDEIVSMSMADFIKIFKETL